MATIRDVAKLAGVSAATVSKVLNEKKGVSDPLRERVQEAIKALDYHPDGVARSLRVRRTRIVGMVMPQIASPFFTEVLRGAEDEARREGYSIVICDSGANATQERHLLAALLAKGVDGVLLASADPAFVANRFAGGDVPLVLFDRVPAGYRGAAVTTTNTEAAYEATNYLVRMGHSRIAIIMGPLNISTALERLEGFRGAMGEARLPVLPEYLRTGGFRLDGGYHCGLELMSLPMPPTAIFSCNYEMTLGLMRAIDELHVKCPRQVSVLGFDDFVMGTDGFSWATLFCPKLTTVAQPSYEIGIKSMQLLRDKILRLGDQQEERHEEVIRLKAELRIRESTAPPAASEDPVP